MVVRFAVDFLAAGRVVVDLRLFEALARVPDRAEPARAELAREDLGSEEPLALPLPFLVAFPLFVLGLDVGVPVAIY